MKFTTSAFLPALCCSAGLASASSARIYIHDPQQRDVSSRDVSPVAARLVMAQRIGVEDFHSADLDQDEVIEAINDYGLQTPMFAAKAAGCEKKAFVLYKGKEDVEASLSSYTSFAISPAPASSDAQGLTNNFVGQSNSRFSKAELSDAAFHFIDSASELTAELNRLVEQNHCITVLTTPLDTPSSSKFQWGSYALPRSKRAAPAPEAPLSDFHASVQSDSSAPSFHSLANNSNSSSTPLRGILPACFTSQSACESATRNCTGHGSCSKAYRDPDSGSNGLDCYSCRCKATKSENGKKTTVWAGPACQKKDVSVEFWLIALFTIALMGLVGFAVGSVWEMGSEELPSVIGAGVSGPTARK